MKQTLARCAALLVIAGCGEEPEAQGPTLGGLQSTDTSAALDATATTDGAGEDASGAHSDGQAADAAAPDIEASDIGASDIGAGDAVAGDTLADASQGDASADDAGGPDVALPDADQPDTPDTSEPDTPEPDTPEPDTPEPDSGATPDAVGADAASSDAASADTEGSDSAADAAQDAAGDATGDATGDAQSDAGATDASAPDAGCVKQPEACDGLDNDCDGQTDEGGLCSDGKPCTLDTCDGKAGCLFKAVVASATPACDGQVVAGRCYRGFTHSPRTWAASEAACKAWGGHLVSIASSAENQAAVARAKASCKGAGSWFIGANDLAKEGAWQWTDGTPFGFKAWGSGEPNDWFGEDVAVQLSSGQWNDVDKDDKLGCTVCERAAPVACDDADACTTGDACFPTGACVGKAKSCDDGNACTTDICDAKVGCSHGKLAEGASCGGGGACKGGVCVVGTSSQPAASCLALHKVDPKAKSGVYWLDPDGVGGVSKFRAWCDMSADGGGWTLVLKIDGKKTTFSYNNSRWTSTKSHNAGSFDLKESEAKLASYWSVPFSELRVGMKAYGKTKWLQVALSGTSLRHAIAPGKHVASKAGRNAWLGLIDGASLQKYCNAEGLNVGTSHSRVRIGIVGNNEKDCKTPDSRLGFGGDGKSCYQDPKNSCGNAARCGAHKGNRNTKAFGWVFVR